MSDPFTAALSAGGNFLSSLVPYGMSALMGNTGRVSHEHFMEGEARADISNTRQISRENEFLSGVTKNRAENYNVYQDTVSGQDTRRNVERIQTMAKDLGMSPWELTGQGSGSQVSASPGGADTNNKTADSQQYLQSLVPLQIARINARTQLAQTQMQTETAKEVSGVKPQKGSLQQQQLMNELQRFSNLISEKRLTDTKQSTELVAQGTMLFDRIIQLLPKQTINAPGFQQQQIQGGPELAKLIDALQETKVEDRESAISKYLQKLPADQWRGLVEDAGKALNALGEGANKAVEETTKFLGSLFK